MRRPWKALLAVVLSLSMLLSLTVTGFAAPNNDNMIELELEQMDPGKLNVPLVGQLDENEATGMEVEKPLYADNDIVRVSIVLEKEPTLATFSAEDVADNRAAMSYRHGLKQQQATLTDRIESATGRKLDVKWNLTLAMNVISANVRYGDIAAIEKVAGVKSVELETRYEPQRVADRPNTAITSEHMVFATSAWADGYTGAGSRVAIIDTGTDQDHIAFDPTALIHSLWKNGQTAAELNLLGTDEITGVLSELNANNRANKHEIPDAEYVYKNEKIPFAFNYVDGNNTTDHSADTQGEHGSHVAGIAVANRFIRDGNDFVDAAASDKAKAIGIAPDAQLLTMKVFGTGGGAYDSDYMAAIEDAILLKADSVNLSLGSAAPGRTFSGTYEAVLDSLVESNTVMTNSAGNSGGWNDSWEPGLDLYAEDVDMHTGGSPGSFINSLGIASADNVGSTGTPLIFNGAQAVFFNETSGYGNPGITSIAGDYEFVYVDGVGNVDEYEAVNAVAPLEGKVVLCNRGGISFYVKGNNAAGYKPVAVVVGNNQPGTINMNLQGFTGGFPMVSITQADADEIKANADGSGTVTVNDTELNYYTGTISVNDKVSSTVNIERSEAKMSSFSSWGTTDALLMKPELTTPGGNIWSVNGFHLDEKRNEVAQDHASYEIMSGTSMAAPHAAGMAGVLGQYIRENKLLEKTDGNARHLINSLLMSTATPMTKDGEYVSILQQGAGLGDVYAATQAASYITMGADATRSAADGKVKVELGQDAKREGAYKYTFTINNLTAENMFYDLNTDMFTQNIYEDEGELFMSRDTRALDATVNYSVIDSKGVEHDVNLDGVTNKDDAQAILDYLTGKWDQTKTIDLEAGEMDEDGATTTYDAHLLLVWLDERVIPAEDEIMVPAEGSVTIQVEITLSDAEKERLNKENVGGAYIEGFTYATCTSLTADGAMMDVEHSIPILGFYGSWTDASMFDNTSAVDVAYGTDTKESYTRITNTNYLTVRNSRGSGVYLGNPYRLEENFPAERLAMNNDTTLVDGKYTMLRYAANAFPVVLDDEGGILYTGRVGAADGPYYQVNNATWMGRTTQTAALGLKVKELGLADGDSFTAGVMAVPEYYALMLHPDAKTATLTAEEIVKLYNDGEVGQGALMGYTITVDNQAPEITSARMSQDGKQIEVTAKDNRYIAYLGIMDALGKVEYVGATPAQSKMGEEITTTFYVEGMDLGNAVAIFAGDYAANEDAKLVRLNDGPVTAKKTVYTPATTIEDGKTYIITNTDELGAAKALTSVGSDISYTVASDVVIQENDEQGRYIDPGDMVGLVFRANGTYQDHGSLLQNTDDNLFISWMSYTARAPYMSSTYKDTGFTYDAENSYMIVNTTRWLTYNAEQGNFLYQDVAANRTPVYLWGEATIDVEIDPDNATKVTVEPETAKLIVGVNDTVELQAKVEPLILEDKTVNWSSSDETVATVDENGLVTAVAEGVATITAASNATPSVTASCEVTVLEDNPMDGVINAQVTVNDEPQFVSIDLNDMSITKLGEAETLIGGGRGAGLIWGVTADMDLYSFDIGNDYAADLKFAMNPSYAPLDAANFPTITVTGVVDGEEVSDTMEYTMAATTQIGYLAFYTAEGSLSYFNTPSLGLVALAFAGYETNSEGVVRYFYYALSNKAELLLVEITPSADGDGGELNMRAATLGKINDLDMGGDQYAFSLLYARGCTADELDGLFIADNSGQHIYFVDVSDSNATQFDAVYVGTVKDVSNLACLYDDVLEAHEVVEGLSDRMGESESVMVAETADMAAEAVNASAGSLNAAAPHQATATDPVDGKVTVEISEDPGVTNGLYTITYDPEALTFVSMAGNGKTDMFFESVQVDEENGVVTYAMADLEALDAGVIASAVFQVNTCKDTKVTVVTKERGADLDLNESEELTIHGNTHTEGDVVIENEVPPTCTEDGSHDEVVYCTVCGDELSRETIVDPAIGHDWDAPVWTWSDDFTTATAKFICQNDTDHVEEIEATITKEVTEPTCEEEGNTVYTATVTGPDGETYTDTQAEINDPNGHDWGEGEWTWSADKKTAKVTFTCKTDSSHRVTLDATVTVKTTDATCDKAGSTVFTGTVTGPDGKTYTDTQTETIPALGHDWGEPVWTWSKDKKTATATFTCKNCGEKKEIVDSKVQVKTDKDGKTTHTATITGPDGKTYTNTVKVASVNTGDTFHLALYVGLAAVCAAGLVVLFLHNKKKENRG